MSVYAGKDVVVKVSAAASSGYATVGEQDSVDVSLNVDLEDVTSFGDEAHDQTALLFDGGVEISGRYDGADSGIAIIESGFRNRTDVWAQVTWYSTTGENVQCVVSAFKRSAAPNGTVKFSASLKAKAQSDTTLH